jgi:hypothetical protein
MTRTEKANSHTLAMDFKHEGIRKRGAVRLELFFNEDPELMPEYDRWVKMPSWYHAPEAKTWEVMLWDQQRINEEAIFLLMNFEPTKGFYQYMRHRDRDPLYNQDRTKWHPLNLSYEELKDLLNRMIKVDGIKYGKDKVQNYHKDGDVQRYLINPKDLMIWAQTQGLRIPVPFLFFLDQAENDGVTKISQQEHNLDFIGRTDITEEFKKRFGSITTWEGVRSFLKRKNFNLRKSSTGKPTLSEKELIDLSK